LRGSLPYVHDVVRKFILGLQDGGGARRGTMGGELALDLLTARGCFITKIPGSSLGKLESASFAGGKKRGGGAYKVDGGGIGGRKGGKAKGEGSDNGKRGGRGGGGGGGGLGGGNKGGGVCSSVRKTQKQGGRVVWYHSLSSSITAISSTIKPPAQRRRAARAGEKEAEKGDRRSEGGKEDDVSTSSPEVCTPPTSFFLEFRWGEMGKS